MTAKPETSPDLARRILSLLRRSGGWRTAEWIAASLGREPGQAVGAATAKLFRSRLAAALGQ